MDTTRQFASQIGVGFQEQAHSNVYGDSEADSFKLYRETKCKDHRQNMSLSMKLRARFNVFLRRIST